jgi:DNA-binding response OmpR family regulator
MAEAAVLLVDDDASIRRMLERTLSAEGYDVTAVADGGAALAGVERSMPDLIVLDEQWGGRVSPSGFQHQRDGKLAGGGP